MALTHSCRLCLALYSEADLHNAFTCKIKHTEQSLVDVLFWVFSVEIDATDPYEKNVCQECLLLVEYVIEIKNHFQKNQESLKSSITDKTCEEVGVKSPCSVEEYEHKQRKKKVSKKSNAATSSHSKNVSSPRVRVHLATLEAMCPVRVDLEKLETTSEYTRYKQIGLGRFKKRKYRHFNLDDTLMDDICNSLDDKKFIKTDVFKKDVGVSTDLCMVSKGVNTNASCNSSIFSSSFTFEYFGPSPNKKLPDLTKSKNDNYPNDSDNDSLMDIVNITKDITSSLVPSEVDKDYDWTKITFKKDVGTNTETDLPSPTKCIGINTEINTVEAGVQTKQFRNKNVVQINIQELEEFSPNVWLEPVEYLLERENYQEIDDFCYKKKSENESELEDIKEKHIKKKQGTLSTSESELEDSNQEYIENKRDLKDVKKQRFLDYYNNFSSFAVRELIAGKKMRDNESETTPVFKVSNVCNVFVCNFCSKSFITKTMLNLHCKRAHRSRDNDGTIGEIPVSTNFVVKKRRRRPRKLVGLPKKKGTHLLTKKDIQNCTSYNRDKETEASTDELTRLREDSIDPVCSGNPNTNIRLINIKQVPGGSPSPLRKIRKKVTPARPPTSLKQVPKSHKLDNSNSLGLNNTKKKRETGSLDSSKNNDSDSDASNKELPRLIEEPNGPASSKTFGHIDSSNLTNMAPKRTNFKIKQIRHPKSWIRKNDTSEISVDSELPRLTIESNDAECSAQYEKVDKSNLTATANFVLNKIKKPQKALETPPYASKCSNNETRNCELARLKEVSISNPNGHIKTFNKDPSTPNSTNHFGKKSFGLRRNSIITTYNINSLIRTKTRYQIIPQERKRGRRKGKGNQTSKSVDCNKKSDEHAETDTSYVWDRKSLGTYSAITLYKNHLAEASESNYKKSDLALDNTIRKLACRLDKLESSESNNCFLVKPT